LSDEWIAVNPFGYQTSVHTIGIRFGGDPRDEHLIDGIRQAQQLGLKVMLKPHIWLSEQDGGDWRGTIGFDTEREWKEWFSNYERFLQGPRDLSWPPHVCRQLVGDYDVVEFWHELDYIGINAFFPFYFGGGSERANPCC